MLAFLHVDGETQEKQAQPGKRSLGVQPERASRKQESRSRTGDLSANAAAADGWWFLRRIVDSTAVARARSANFSDVALAGGGEAKLVVCRHPMSRTRLVTEID